MKRILAFAALALSLLSCELNISQNFRQYAVYTLRPQSDPVSGYKALTYDADSGSFFAVTDKNQIHKLAADFSLKHALVIPSTLIEKVSSIMIRNGKLYVSSWSDSNRYNLVLCLDSEGGGKTVQIGNGSYEYTHDAQNGSGPWHPQAVYAGQNYLYVAANGQNIRVYRLADLFRSGWKPATAPFCYLKTGFVINKNSRVTMQERGGELFVATDSSDAICRFTVSDFNAGKAAEAIAPSRLVSKPIPGQPVRTFTFGKTKAAVAAGKYIYLYQLPDFLSDSFARPYCTLTSADDNAFDKIRTLCELQEDGGNSSFTVQGDWGIRRYTAVKYTINAQGGTQ